MLPRLNRSQTSAALFFSNAEMANDQQQPELILYSKKYSNLYLNKKSGKNSKNSIRRRSPEWAGEEGELDKRYGRRTPAEFGHVVKLTNGKPTSKQSVNRRSG